ncbi:unnamed protein product [Calicophoron daubneyi]
MIGVGLTNTNMSRFANDFCSALGLSTTTWGLSYRGNLMHAGVETAVPSAAFKRGAIVGCLLNLWYRTLQFYLDGRLIREACFNDLPPGSYYPMVCSTALRSGFRLIRAESYPISLQILCCHALCNSATKQNSFNVVANSNIPGLLKEIFQTKLPWSLYLGTATEEEPTQLTSIFRPSSHAVLTSNTRGVAYLPLNQDESDNSGECDPFLWTTFSDDESRVSSSGSLCLLDQLDSELEDTSPFNDMYRLDMHNTESSNSDDMVDGYGSYHT